MKIAFLDLSGIAFDPLTPERLPLGGMQSAVCYLSRQLRQRGHEVTFFNASPAEATVEGIQVLNYDRQFEEMQHGHDVFVSISCSGRVIRPLIGDRPLILYTGHNRIEPSMQALLDPRERDSWDCFVFKSSWQALTLQRTFSLDGRKIRIITNGVSPFFEQLGERKSFFFLEDRPPVLYYSSTPFRGLEILARAFPAIAKACPGVTAKIYSSMSPYHGLGDDESFSALYDRCRDAGMDYIGSLSQPELAQAVRHADILAFPTTYAETSCVTVMEAMANSAVIVSRALGAVPETSAGFANLMPVEGPADNSTLPAQFASYMTDVITAARKAPQRLTPWLQAQRRYCLTNYSWAAKAREWDEVLTQATARVDRPGAHAAVASGGQAGICHYVQTISGDKLYLDPTDGRAQRMLQHGGSFNPATAFLWRAALGMAQWDTIADVGANYGEMLFEAGVKTCAQVFAFEPNPAIIPYLTRTMSGSPNVRIMPVALSDRAGEMSFTINRNWSGMSRLGEGPNRITVRVMTLDSLLIGWNGLPSMARPLRLLMKVDVEGRDVDVLKGAALSIARAADFCCLIEVSHLAKADAAWLAQFFTFHALSLQQQRIVEIESLAALSDHARFWHQDVLLRRKTKRSP